MTITIFNNKIIKWKLIFEIENKNGKIKIGINQNKNKNRNTIIFKINFWTLYKTEHFEFGFKIC